MADPSPVARKCDIQGFASERGLFFALGNCCL